VFGNDAFPAIDKRALEISKTHLARHGLATKESPVIKQKDFILPKLQGNNIEEHFYNIGAKHSYPYRDYAKDLSTATLPPQPDIWQQLPGWTRYEQDGAFEPVESPPDEALVFDVETLYKVSPYPVMAVAASATHWYGWVSPWLLKESTDIVQLIPFSSKKKQLLVGHNVGYDRARIREEYNIERTNMRFLDTMALHVAVRGLSSHQRIPWMKHRKRKRKEAEEGLDISAEESSSSEPSTSSRSSAPSSQSLSSAFADGAENKWEDVSSMNSLVDVAKLHCDIDMDKSARDWFSSEDPQEIVDQFQELMTYCANDVLVTHKVFKVVLPAFTDACPHPVSFAGVLHMGSSFLPVDDSWEHFISEAERVYHEYTKGVETELYYIAEQARRLIFEYDENGRPVYESDPWLRQLDWTPKKARPINTSNLLGVAEMPKEEDVVETSSSSASEDSGYDSTYENASTDASQATAAELSEESDSFSSAQAAPRQENEVFPQAQDVLQPELHPQWYKTLLLKASGQITQSGWDQIVPLLLNMTWKGYPLRYSLEHGWYFAVPKTRKKEISALPNRLEEQLAGKQHICFKPFGVIKRNMLSSTLKAAIKRNDLSSSPHPDLVKELCELGMAGKDSTQKARKRPELQEKILELANSAMRLEMKDQQADPWLSQLDWAGWQGPAQPSIHSKGMSAEAMKESIDTTQDADSPAVMQEGSPDLSQEVVLQPESPVAKERRRGRLFSDDSSSSNSHTRSFSTTSPNTDAEEPVRRSSRLFSSPDDSDTTPVTSTAAAVNSEAEESPASESAGKKAVKPKKATTSPEKQRENDLSDAVWPHWYWHMWRPRKDAKDQGAMDLSIRSKAAPLLMKLQWQGYPLASSRQHGWLYRVPKAEWQQPSEEAGDVAQPVTFGLNADINLEEDTEHVYFKLPHKDGAEGNVGTPLSKAFMPAFEEGILSSEYPAARKALDMNAKCSYWISARERVKGQLVVWEKQKGEQGFPTTSEKAKHGMILPQVVTMGTVTRRAVESTWLAASNAKQNRLGSELKAMIRAPPGWKIVGADVDSEELWICCVMGDAQFGVHGATAIGWMTLEGTKSAGTDLHSKTASILGISRDKAKVFNYSRIYGAGVKHATQLLLQSNPKLSKSEAEKLAKTLYASTKGLKQHTLNNRFERKFWHGGTESHVFNTLEAIAMAADPRTPALGCAITAALAKGNLPKTEKSKAGEDFMPSRINWVVQSSGVDYLHLLIVSMEYLCEQVSRVRLIAAC